MTNRGSGAGGAKTTKNGSQFEDAMDSEPHLLKMGFSKIQIGDKSANTGLTKQVGKKTVYFFKQRKFNYFISQEYGKDVCRQPDESFVVVEDKKKTKIFIVEKKNQNTTGTVEDKLGASDFMRMCYEDGLGTDFEVEYALCLSSWFKTRFKSQKYMVLQKWFEKHNIKYFFGEDESYVRDMFSWVGIYQPMSLFVIVTDCPLCESDIEDGTVCGCNKV
jgi:hypothetical protein